MKFRESSFWPANRTLFRRRSRSAAWVGVATVFVLVVLMATGSHWLR